MKTFLVDVDGVTGKLVQRALSRLTDLGYKDLPKFEDIKTDIFKKEETPFKPDALDALKKWANLPGIVKTLDLEDGAAEGIAKIKARKHDVFWVSAPHHTSETWAFDRRFWIKQEFGDDYRKVASIEEKWRVDGDVFIDDKVKNVKLWQEAHPTKIALLYDQPWNKDAVGFPRFTWKQIDVLLDELEK